MSLRMERELVPGQIVMYYEDDAILKVRVVSARIEDELFRGKSDPRLYLEARVLKVVRPYNFALGPSTGDTISVNKLLAPGVGAYTWSLGHPAGDEDCV